jgi:imidazoleglycerol-phosphate dehydratase
MEEVMSDKRRGTYSRKTKETDINVVLELESAADSTIQSGVPFFDHMLNSFAKHGLLSLNFSCKGDTHVDDHHTVEDAGICLGKALVEAIADRKGITRFGFASVPMDDALCQVSIDMSGRPYCRIEGADLTGAIGKYSGELTREFIYALAVNGEMNLHVNVVYGDNLHHMHEALFKALGIAIRKAVAIDPLRKDAIPSTKGTLS